MRGILDSIYSAALWLAALCLLAIAVLVGLQVGGRMLDAVLGMMGAPKIGFVILSLSEIAGYLLAAASFLALGATLQKGVHIRVTMFLGMMSESVRRSFELGVLAFGAIAATYAMVWTGALAYGSWVFNEVSSGLVPVQLVYPQAAIAAGLLILAISFVDQFTITLRTGRPSFRASEDAVALGKEG